VGKPNLAHRFLHTEEAEAESAAVLLVTVAGAAAQRRLQTITRLENLMGSTQGQRLVFMAGFLEGGGVSGQRVHHQVLAVVAEVVHVIHLALLQPGEVLLMAVAVAVGAEPMQVRALLAAVDTA
jgi:hypothetical protein